MLSEHLMLQTQSLYAMAATTHICVLHTTTTIERSTRRRPGRGTRVSLRGTAMENVCLSRSNLAPEPQTWLATPSISAMEKNLGKGRSRYSGRAATSGRVGAATQGIKARGTAAGKSRGNLHQKLVLTAMEAGVDLPRKLHYEKQLRWQNLLRK